MAREQAVPWLRIAAESVAIVASILLALTADAWWAAEQDRRTQSEELDRLYEEFTRVHDQLGPETDGQEQAHDAVAELFQLVQRHVARDEPLEVSNELLLRSIGTVTVDLATPVLDGLVLSGRLENFQSEDVVSAIAGWQKALSELREIEQTSRNLLLNFVIPVFTERANMGDVLARVNLDGTTLIFVDDELEGHLGYRVQSTRLVTTRLDELIVSLARVLGAIKEAQVDAAGT